MLKSNRFGPPWGTSEVVCGIHFVLMLIMKSVPTPTLLVTFTEPPIYSIICLQMERPRPVPDLLRSLFSSSFPKSTNKFWMPSSLIPTPLSLTVILSSMYIFSRAFESPDYEHSWLGRLLLSCMISFSSTKLDTFKRCWSIWFLNLVLSYLFVLWALMISIFTFISPPGSVNFKELLRKLSRIYRYLRLSPRIAWIISRSFLLLSATRVICL